LLPIGVKAYKDDIKLAINLAHPIVEEKNNLLYNLGIKLGFVSTYNLYQANLDEGVRKIIAQIPTKSPAYIHTFAKTPNFFIIYENPLRLKLSKLFFANKSFIDSYVWTNKPINFIILNTSGKVLMQIEHEPSFCFHVVNSFEFKDKIYLDLITYPNADIIQAFYLNSQINLDKHNITPTLYRYILDMNTSSCSKYKLIDQKIEFPIINNNYMQKAYNFIYATSIIHNEFQLDSLIKIDLANNLYKIWHESGCFPSEAVFIAKPDGLIEDEGVIMSIVADIKHKVSFLLVLDAKSFHEITRISLPHMLPMGLHGAFYPTPEKNAK
jgi:carotenoid cleavage dioxygenase-like enzyme